MWYFIIFGENDIILNPQKTPWVAIKKYSYFFEKTD